MMITEHFVTGLEVKDFQKYAKSAWALIEPAYEYCGGLAGIKDYETFYEQFCTEEAQKEENYIWKMVRRGKNEDGTDKITAIKIYKQKRGGRKGVASASDGTDQGKKDLYMILKEDYTFADRQVWCEVSGKAISAALKSGCAVMPREQVIKLMQDKYDKGQIKWTDDDCNCFYERPIGGGMHTKMLVCNSANAKEYNAFVPSEDEIKKIKEYAIKYYEVDEKRNKKDNELAVLKP